MGGRGVWGQKGIKSIGKVHNRANPSGISGDAIPLPGRIVTVADVFDALTHRRPYKEPWPISVAVREIIGEAGTKFDPHVTEAFARLDHATLVQPAASRPAPVTGEATIGRGPAAEAGAAAA